MFDKFWRKLTVKPLEPLTSLQAARGGRVALQGKLSSQEAAISPMKMRACAAFYYRATYRYGSRMKGFVQQKLLDAMVYGPGLTLEVDDGIVELAPRKSQDFEPEAHKGLTDRKIDGFKASERLIPQGAVVVARGKLRRAGDQWRMALDGIQYEPPKKESRSGGSMPKKKKKQG